MCLHENSPTGVVSSYYHVQFGLGHVRQCRIHCRIGIRVVKPMQKCHGLVYRGADFGAMPFRTKATWCAIFAAPLGMTIPF